MLATMRLRFLFVFASVLVGHVDSMTISGKIEDDIAFYYMKLPTYPARLVNVTIIVYPQGHHETIHVNVYTTEDHLNLKRRCTAMRSGQLSNNGMHFYFSSSICTECGHLFQIQDYKPRNYAFSLGFNCEDAKTHSLKGIAYAVHIKGMSNQSTCFPMPPTRLNCSQFYSYVSHPNLLTHETTEIAAADINRKIFKYKERTFILENTCYQHFLEMLCHIVLPKCDNTLNTTMFPCKETCEEAVKFCLPHIPKFASFVVKDNYHCDYLPSVHGNIPCFYRPVICQSPPEVSNATIVNKLNENITYMANSTVEYKCINDEHKMESHSEIACLYTGKWSEAPRCVLNDETNENLWVILLPVIGPATTTVFIALLCKCKLKKRKFRKEMLTRIKDYDAYVCYCFDTDNGYVMNTILPQLEERHDPPFKLYIDCRDFQIGQSIKQNIKEAVENSNSAVIVMTQDFINSYWCKEEFTDCYIEHMKDPAFKLFVIMMQEKEELVNMTEYMESYIAENTYLKQDDPDLITKIAEYLIWVKQPKEERNVNERDEPNETDSMVEEQGAEPV